MKKTNLIFLVFVVLSLLIGCAKSAGETVVTIGGKEYTKADLERFDTLEVNYTAKDGNTTTYNGVVLRDLIADAGLSSATITFSAIDGYQAEAELTDLIACTNCILAFVDDSLRTVMPDMSGKLQVKDVVEISGY